MINRFKPLTFERIIFYALLIASVLAVLFNSSNPALDSPTHLYNARNISYLVSGNEFISRFYALNKIPAPNLTDHYMLSLFMSVFSWRVAEKLLIAFYLLSFSLLFRTLILKWKPENIRFSIFAIPFSFSVFYYLGFYNYCLSISLLFGLILYYSNHFWDEKNAPLLKNYLLLFTLITLLYFTNGLVFLFAGLSLFLLEVTVSFRTFFSPQTDEKKAALKRLVFFFILWIPSLVCFKIFMDKIHLGYGTGSNSIDDLLKMNPLAVFMIDEINPAKYLVWTIAISLVTAIWYRIKNRSGFNQSDVFIIIALVVFFCYLFVPDNASVGMMSIRLCYLFLIFLLLWIAMQPGSKIVGWIVYFVVILLHYKLLFRIHQQILADFNKKVETITNAGKIIRPNSVVLTIDYNCDMWTTHFPYYLGCDKPLVIIDNGEVDAGWFAITWNDNRLMPQLLLDGKTTIAPYFNPPHSSSPKTATVDYIFIWGNYTDFVKGPENKALNEILSKDYKLIYTSDDNKAHIFSVLQ